MGARNVLRLMIEALTGSNPEKLDLASGDVISLLPVTDDQGVINVGDGTNDMDVKVFLGASTDYVEFNVGDGQVNVESAELHFGDNDSLEFGDGTDVTVNWNATHLEVNKTGTIFQDFPNPMDPDPAVAHGVLDDFYTLDTTATVGGWAAFNVGTGTTTLADDVGGGVLLMTCQAATDDACEQLNQVSAPFLLAAGKTLWYECRFKLVGDITQSEIAVGLCALGEDLTAVADVKPADGVAFTKQDGATGFALTASKNGTNTGESAATLHTLVNNTYVRLGFLIDGVTSVTPYVNGVAGTAITATIPDDESLGMFLLVRNGDGTTQEVLHVDYVKVVQIR